MPESPYPMIPVAEALARVLATVEPLPVERVRFEAALGRVLAEPVVAAEALPPFPAATVDGFAVRAGEGAASRRLVGARYAGEEGALVVGAGEAARIMTGAPLPDGADAVMMVEWTAIEGETVHFARGVGVGDYLRPVGSDIAAGETVLRAGDPLGPTEIGLLATVGATEIEVYRRPVVGVLSTGDELVPPDGTPGPGQIRDSNRYALLATLRLAGAEALDLGIAPDEAAALERFLGEATARCDALVTSGGVSMGERDLVKPMLEQRSTVHFGRVNMKPGKPTTFATLDGRPFFALPGNPVSSLVAFELFVRPALRKLGGFRAEAWERPRLRVALAHPIERDDRRDEFQRAILDFSAGRITARNTGAQGSSRLLSMVGADALIHLPRGRPRYAAGDEVEALWLGAG